MSHKLFRLFFVLTLIIGLAVIPAPQSVRAAGLWYVSTTGNDVSDCQSPTTTCETINGAIGKATAGDTINVATGTYTGTGSEVVLIDIDITLSGGWDSGFSIKNGASVIDGEFTRRGVTISASITAYMEYFVVQNGDLIDGKNGIANDGNLTLEKVTIQHNGTNPGSGGISGINNSATGVLTLSNSAVINNGTVNNCFGGIWNEGNLTAINSTISGNISNRIYCYGAALIGYGTVSLHNTTIVNNIGDTDMMGAFGTFTLTHSLIGSCGNSTSMTSQGYNIISINTCPITPTNGDRFGTSGLPIDLMIDPLQDNGGPTLTHALLPGSPAIDAGSLPDSDCPDQFGNPLTIDQRGVFRPQGERCDIGAFEFEGQPLPPANDNFVNAEQISSLPFFATVSTSGAGLEPGEPLPFFVRQKTAWYTFTPAETMTIATDTMFNVNVYRASGPGFGNLSFLGSSLDNGGSFSLLAEAERTYYLQVDGVGAVEFSLLKITPPPANDNFSSATLISSPLPFDNTVNTLEGSIETDEPTPSCANNSQVTKSVWYAFTPTTSGSISASIPAVSFTPVFAAYTGNALVSLTEVGCQIYSGNLLTLHVNAGTTYYFQVGNLFPWEQGGSMQFHLDVPPSPQTSFYYYPGDPSRFDTIQFQDNSYDPGNLGIQTYVWSFGDGSIASGYSATHKYATDGDYSVTHTVTTVDGRTASITQTVQVRTHDVSITKITTPNSANVGQTKTITVTVRNIAYPETVQIDLFKSTPTGFVWVATVTKSVPALSGNRTIAFDFNYKFTSDDAKIGKVTFRAVATIVNARDAWPSDNEVISLQTKVAK